MISDDDTMYKYHCGNGEYFGQHCNISHKSIFNSTWSKSIICQKDKEENNSICYCSLGYVGMDCHFGNN